MRYAVKLSLDDNGAVLIAVPDAPTGAAFDASREEALARAVHVVETAITVAIAAGADVRAP